MTLLAQTTKGTLLAAVLLALVACGKPEEPSAPPPAGSELPTSAADCDKLPDPKPADDSAAGRATAVSEGKAAREACKKAVAKRDAGNDDLARIREIKENEEADRKSRKVAEEEWKRGVKEGAEQPLKEYKY